MERFWTTFFYIVVMAAVLVAAYLTTRFLAQKSRRMSSRHIRMHDSMMIGRDKHIAVIEVAGKTLLIGITNQSINVLADIDANALKNARKKRARRSRRALPPGLPDFCRNEGRAQNLSAARTRMKKPAGKARRGRRFLRQMDEAIKKEKPRGRTGRGGRMKKPSLSSWPWR